MSSFVLDRHTALPVIFCSMSRYIEFSLIQLFVMIFLCALKTAHGQNSCHRSDRNVLLMPRQRIDVKEIMSKLVGFILLHSRYGFIPALVSAIIVPLLMSHDENLFLVSQTLIHKEKAVIPIDINEAV